MKLSQGTVCNMLKKLTKKCKPIYEQIRERLMLSLVIGGDETGCVVNGLKWWMWTWQNKELTYIKASETRGYRAITESFPIGFPNSILVTDCWASQLKTSAQKHQICMSHIQRELKYFIDSCKNRWSKQFLHVIYQALSLKKRMSSEASIILENDKEKLRAKANKLLKQTVKGPKKLQALKNRLIKNIDSLWVFLDHKEVPPDNNGSERAIRNVKVKQKISGQFRTSEGASQFAILRSVYDTIRKNNGQSFLAFSQLANFVPE